MTAQQPENSEKRRADDALAVALVSVIAHDIVGPLSFDSNILGVLAAKDAFSQSDMETLRAVHGSLVQISGKAAGLLQLAREVHALGDTVPEGSAADESAELGTLLRGTAEFTAAHNPGFSYEIKTSGKIPVKGPSAVLRTAVENVLSNAARHGKNGAAVSIRMYLEGDSAVVEVENAMGEINTPAGGNGIGLDISRKLLAICFGGRLETWAENGIFRTEIRIPVPF